MKSRFNRILVFAATTVATVIAVAHVGCEKKKNDAIPGPSTTAPVAETKPSAPVDTIALLTRPATRPGIIQAGDWLRISVDGLTSLNKATVAVSKVDSDGRLNFPLLGPMPVIGMNDGQVQQSADKAYQTAHIISEARVIVQRVYLSHPGDATPGPIHPNDLVRVDVFDLQGLGVASSTIARVNSAGEIFPPILPAQKIAGLSDSTAGVVIADGYKKAQILSNALVKVTTLEAAPPNADHLDLPDGPVYPVPEALKSLFTP